ncbi:MAG TPA: MBL fold metallo-hydrolase [Ornithinicoccus sp.]|nr:MBL fold metallo-hydrolase [Ornithinicoccus sp.]
MDAPATPAPGWSSRAWGERAWCQLCPNPGPMTLDGTNTWLLREPGADEVVVVDPGPLDEGHLRAVLDKVAAEGGRVALTLLTHHHWDHAQSARRFAELTGAPVRAVGEGHDDLADGDVIRVGGLELLVVTTPGHTADSVSFLLTAENVLLTGDTVLGRGTTVVSHPDGELAAYLDSLERIERLTGAGRVTSIAPGHGPVVPDAAGTVRYYLEHRRERLEQVRAVLRRVGDRPPGEGDLADLVVREVYADVPREVWPAARLSVLAQLDYLRERG